jgi:hypothetical protein
MEVFIFEAFSAWKSSSPSLLGLEAFIFKAFAQALGKKTSHSRVAGPPICSPSPSWPVLMMKV